MDANHQNEKKGTKMSSKALGETLSLAVCAILLGVGWYSLELGEEPAPPTNQKLVEVANWNWKKDRSGRILAVFGTVRNNTSETFSSVTLELRTEDETKTVVGRHRISVGRLGPKEERPFREDVPRTGQETMGFLEVKTLGR